MELPRRKGFKNAKETTPRISDVKIVLGPQHMFKYCKQAGIFQTQSHYGACVRESEEGWAFSRWRHACPLCWEGHLCPQRIRLRSQCTDVDCRVCSPPREMLIYAAVDCDSPKHLFLTSLQLPTPRVMTNACNVHHSSLDFPYSLRFSRYFPSSTFPSLLVITATNLPCI